MNKILIYLVGALLLTTACSTSNSNESKESEQKQETKKVKMILDLDTGIDDAMALAYAVGCPDIELIGVTGIYGNVSLKTSVQNSINLLQMLNRTDIPVFEGVGHAQSEQTIYEASEVGRFIHGNNGLGNVTIANSDKKVESQNAIDFMIESAKKYGKDLVIVAVGPMTNLNAAIKKEPKLSEMVGGIVIMGGALIVEGNVSKVAEANIFQDPIAANELFTSGTHLTMVGLDVTQRTNLTKKDTQIWRDLGTVSGKAFADIVDYYIDAYGESAPELAGCALHDPLAASVAVHPEFVKTLSLHMKVGTGEQDWGRTIGDNGKMNNPNPNVAVCVDVEVDEFVSHFMQTLTDLFKKN